MAKSKVYTVLADGNSVFTGSYRSSIVVFDALRKFLELYELPNSPALSISFTPYGK